jgi:hypothetical protein
MRRMTRRNDGRVPAQETLYYAKPASAGTLTDNEEQARMLAYTPISNLNRHLSARERVAERG